MVAAPELQSGEPLETVLNEEENPVVRLLLQQLTICLLEMAAFNRRQLRDTESYSLARLDFLQGQLKALNAELEKYGLRVFTTNDSTFYVIRTFAFNSR